MKKSFTKGLDSLIGPAKDELLEQASQAAKKKGRQPEQKARAKASQEGTKPGETRATFIIQEDLLEDMKAIAYWEREKIKDVLNRALAAEVARYKKAHKTLKPKPKGE